MGFQLFIQKRQGERIMMPCVLDGVDLELNRQGAPGKLTFTVIKDGGLSFIEGDCVFLNVAGVDVFRGYVVKKSRNKNHQIEVTCYDQLFYLAQNQTRYVARGVTASKAIKELCAERGVLVGDIVDTGYTIVKHRIDSATSYLDIIQELLDVTLAYTGKMFVLYDDVGNLTLKNIDDMKYNEDGNILLVSEEGAEDFDYESSIENTYASVLVFQKVEANSEAVQNAVPVSVMDTSGLIHAGQSMVVMNEDGSVQHSYAPGLYNGSAKTDSFERDEDGCLIISKAAQKSNDGAVNAVAGEGKKGSLLLMAACEYPEGKAQWGNLTYHDEVDSNMPPEDIQQRARALLELHAQVKRKLNINGVFCDPRIRPGSSVLVAINLGDIDVKQFFLVESVTHHFKNDHSTMDLTVKSSKGFVL